jgi:NAD(P)-dependent dehydrogenase (short-subunit alcohol dehydrogenase family)
MTTLTMVTGASRGIGAAVAAAAEADGAVVATCNRGRSDAAHQLTADLSDPTTWAELARWYDDLVDRLNPDRCVVVHNAATLTPIGFAGATDPGDYQANVLLNSAAPQVIGSAVLATAHRTGTPTVLVQLTSGAGKTPYPGWSSYCAAKAAVDMWVRAVGTERSEGDQLVRVVAVAPGVVATDMQAEIRTSDVDAFPEVERFQSMHDDGQLADPADVGRRLWELADRGTWTSGEVLDLRELD